MKNKKKCSCYGGFDCNACNPDKYKQEKSANDWLSDLMGSNSPYGSIDEVPEGWLTKKQMEEMLGLPESTVHGRIEKGIKSGILQKKQFKIKTGHQIVPVWHYNKA